MVDVTGWTLGQVGVALAELAELRRFAELSAGVWLEMTGGAYPDPGDEWGHLCWNTAKQIGLLPLDERDVEYERTT